MIRRICCEIECPSVLDGCNCCGNACNTAPCSGQVVVILEALDITSVQSAQRHVANKTANVVVASDHICGCVHVLVAGERYE